MSLLTANAAEETLVAIVVQQWDNTPQNVEFKYELVTRLPQRLQFDLLQVPLSMCLPSSFVLVSAADLS
jgi:hypothetical protein